MTDERKAREHREIAELIPWYVNGTLGERDRRRVDSHVLSCSACRDDLSLERRVYETVATKPGIEYMPAASLKRLHAALDELGTLAVPAAAAPPVGRRAAHRPAAPWRGWAAACVALAAVAVTLMMVDRWNQYRAGPAPASYHTVSTSIPRAPDEVIRAVFSPSITLVELQAILDEAQLGIISGPTEAGVYSLAATSGRPVSSSLALLRRHAEVRFAESTQTGAAVHHESP
jgi:anti-sigma factor RsiW